MSLLSMTGEISYLAASWAVSNPPEKKPKPFSNQTPNYKERTDQALEQARPGQIEKRRDKRSWNI